MATQKILIKPGISTQFTKLLNEYGFSSCQLVRFKDGLLQKLGGWAKFASQQLNGVCRGLIANQDLNGNQYLAIGTNTSLDIYENSVIYNITPVSSTINLTTPFSTTSGLKTVNVHDVAHGQSAGNPIYVGTYTYLDGVVIQGFYIITSIVDADNYTITIANAATSTVAAAGLTSLFSTTNTLFNVTITLNNHGFIAGDTYTVFVSTAVGGITFFGQYPVASVTDANNFVIVSGLAATSTTTGRENGGNIRINNLLAAGPINTVPLTGFGIGPYGYGPYGFGTSGTTILPARQWHFAPWGEDMICSPSYGAMYIWDASSGVVNNPATLIAAAPSINTSILIAMPQRQVVSLGAETGGTQDPLLIRWSDVDDYTDWTALVTNQAGSFRLPDGGRIVGGINSPQQILVWTDTSLWAMQYIQPPFVYGFNKLGDGYGLAASRAMGTLGSRVFWMGHDGFFVYDGGGISPVPCSVWDFIFQNLNQQQLEKITCAPNSSFNEISWYFPSASGSGEVDMYVKYNAAENLWDYGTLCRTAWIDQSLFVQPMGVDESGYIQQHEISNDADGSAMVSYAQTGFFKLSDGHDMMFIERMIPDFILSSGATGQITVYTQNYPFDTPVASSVFSVTSASQYAIIRKRGRLVSIKVGSGDLGSFWRLGSCLFWVSQAGLR